MYMMQKCKYVAKNDSQLQMTLPKCVAISQKLQISFRFLNPALYIYIYCPKQSSSHHNLLHKLS